MLILTRKAGETITLINKETKEEIEIAYLGNNSKTQIRVGISAPRHVDVMRTEVIERGDYDGNR